MTYCAFIFYKTQNQYMDNCRILQFNNLIDISKSLGQKKVVPSTYLQSRSSRRYLSKCAFAGIVAGTQMIHQQKAVFGIVVSCVRSKKAECQSSVAVCANSNISAEHLTEVVIRTTCISNELFSSLFCTHHRRTSGIIII